MAQCSTELFPPNLEDNIWSYLPTLVTFRCSVISGDNIRCTRVLFIYTAHIITRVIVKPVSLTIIPYKLHNNVVGEIRQITHFEDISTITYNTSTKGIF